MQIKNHGYYIEFFRISLVMSNFMNYSGYKFIINLKIICANCVPFNQYSFNIL